MPDQTPYLGNAASDRNKLPYVAMGNRNGFCIKALTLIKCLNNLHIPCSIFTALIFSKKFPTDLKDISILFYIFKIIYCILDGISYEAQETVTT